MNEEQELPEVMEDPEHTKYRIQEESRLKEETNRQLAEMDKQIAYSEKLSLREIKKEAFKMAIQIKPQQTSYSSTALGQTPSKDFSTEDLIISANKIYNELIK